MRCMVTTEPHVYRAAGIVEIQSPPPSLVNSMDALCHGDDPLELEGIL